MTTTYNPKLSDANRYENARIFNKKLADKINQEALLIVKTAEPILKKVEANPQNRYFHDSALSKIGDSRWMGHYLIDANKQILYELYGMACVNTLERAVNIPKEVISFINKTKNLTL